MTDTPNHTADDWWTEAKRAEIARDRERSGAAGRWPARNPVMTNTPNQTGHKDWLPWFVYWGGVIGGFILGYGVRGLLWH